VRIATRGSALALVQANWVAERLRQAGSEIEIVPLVTSGDRRRDVDDKREWIIELEEALLAGEADLAVHSAKDVPVEIADGLSLIAAPERADPRDVLCGATSLDALPDGARVGTASLRRASQLRARRPGLAVVELRGNVDTRLRKLADGEADAIVLAAAGLQRLGRADAVDCVLDLVPAAGQGTLVIEARTDDERVRHAVAALHHDATWAALRAERAVVAALQADCRTPVGVHAEVHDGTMRVRGFVGAVDGSAWVSDEVTCPPSEEPEAVGARLGERLLAAGAAEVLGR
jgi:hydroxymethylbilane synthase